MINGKKHDFLDLTLEYNNSAEDFSKNNLMQITFKESDKEKITRMEYPYRLDRLGGRKETLRI